MAWGQQPAPRPHAPGSWGPARAADRPALRAFFDRLNGPEGDPQTWSIADRKTLWTFLLYPLDVAPSAQTG